jgi:hypothetical protein
MSYCTTSAFSGHWCASAARRGQGEGRPHKMGSNETLASFFGAFAGGSLIPVRVGGSRGGGGVIGCDTQHSRPTPKRSHECKPCDGFGVVRTAHAFAIELTAVPGMWAHPRGNCSGSPVRPIRARFSLRSVTRSFGPKSDTHANPDIRSACRRRGSEPRAISCEPRYRNLFRETRQQ